MPARKPNPLSGLRILIVEDELLCAMELEQLLRDLDCEVVGPVGRVGDVVPAADSAALDGALLDVNLHGQRSYPAASALRGRNIAVVMVTGYGELPDCPDDLKGVPTVNKPFNRQQIEQAMSMAISRRNGAGSR
jgi:DNA-binding NarL/FixJ family response regulator